MNNEQMNKKFSDFRKFATDKKVNGSYMSGLMIDDYTKKMNNNPRAYQTPYIVEGSSNYGVSVDIFSRLMRDRIIFIGDEIEPDMANIIVGQMLYLSNDDSKKDIDVYVNSPGGDVISGLSIYSTGLIIEPKIKTFVTGMAASMACILASSMASVGDRYLLEYAWHLMHQPMGGASGQCSDIEIACDNIKKHRDTLYNILSKSTGHPVDEIMKDADRDHWFNAKEAIEYGLADKILESKKKMKTKGK